MSRARGMRWLAAASLVGLGCLVAPAAAQEGETRGVGPAPERVRYDGWQLARVRIDRARDLLTVSAAGGREAACGGAGIGESEFLLPPGAGEVLRAAGLKVQVLNPDLQRGIDAERAQIEAARAGGVGLRGPGWFSTYHDYAEISAYVDTLVAAHPALASRFTAGQSLQLRDLFGIRITSAVGTNKPQVMLNAMQHAREWAGGASAMWIATTLLEGYGTDADITRLLDGYEIYILPVSNPDGYVHTWASERLWRKNRRDNGDGSFGVDNNRNWGFQWGGPGASGTPNNETYRGPSAFSEPETQALRDFALSLPRLVFHVDIHTFSQLILSSWGYTVDVPPDQPVINRMGLGMRSAMQGLFGSVFSQGPTYTTIYPASGVMPDWMHGAAGSLSWTFELRDRGQFGFVLPADQIVPAAQEAWAGVKSAAIYLLDHALFVEFVDGTPTSVPAGATATLAFEVRRAMLTPGAGPARLLWRRGRSGAFTDAGVTGSGAGSYVATIAPGPCNSVVQFYVEAQATTGQTVLYPPAGGAGPFEAVVRQFNAALADGAETDLAWSLGVAGDTATGGAWTRGNPVGTSAQPEDAHAGTNCFFTGQGLVGGNATAADVDNGFTTLLSPAFSVGGASDARISYWRWYVNNNAGNYTRDDLFNVEVSNNGGATWTLAESIGPNGLGTQGTWIRATWRLSDLTPPLAPTANMRLRFIASDTGTQQVLEAAVDDVLVESIACPLPPCAGDWDGDGAVVPSDIASFINAWLADLSNGTLAADFDDNGAVEPADVASFVSAWVGSLAGGCGG